MQVENNNESDFDNIFFQDWLSRDHAQCIK